jgi:hypothetical protein
MKIRLVGAELFRADGQTDMTRPVVALGSFANTLLKQPTYPRVEKYCSQCQLVCFNTQITQMLPHPFGANTGKYVISVR